MSLRKFTFGQHLQLLLLSPILNAIIWLLTASYRKNRGLREQLKAARAMNENGRCIIALWHCNCMASLATHADLPLSIMVSSSFDGEMISKLVHTLGLHSIRGSSSRGGKQALSQSNDALRAGRVLGITVDGPRGPRFKAKFGAVSASRNTQTPIVPLLAYPDRYWTFRSWDRLKLAKPFARLSVLYGEPILVPVDTTEEGLAAYNDRLEKSLMALEEQVNTLTNGQWNQ
jgi:lysophospholipid acyltransferase (LPLAT)-like uncharacterized protein